MKNGIPSRFFRVAQTGEGERMEGPPLTADGRRAMISDPNGGANIIVIIGSTE